MTAWLGWLATGVFVASYLTRNSSIMRRIQAAAALLWIVYGVQMNAAPVIGANVLVAAAALFAEWRIQRG